MRIPATVDCGTPAGMLQARDGLIRLWNMGGLTAEEAIGRLRVLQAVDARGAVWRMRPSADGVVFLRAGDDGVPAACHPSQFVLPRRPFERVAWAALAVAWLAAVALFAAA